jgi:hypothetical protein
MVDFFPDVGVLCEGGIELNHDAVQPVFKKNNALPDVAFLSSGFEHLTYSLNRTFNQFYDSVFAS